MYLEKDKDISVHTQLVGATATGAAASSVDTLTADGKAHQIILVVTGTGAQTVKLEHSDDNTTFTDMGAEVTTTANNAGMVLAKYPKRYVRANATTVESTTVVDASILLTGYDNVT